jgi:hypothetical protein
MNFIIPVNPKSLNKNVNQIFYQMVGKGSPPHYFMLLAVVARFGSISTSAIGILMDLLT